jgi:hypothetical protein
MLSKTSLRIVLSKWISLQRELKILLELALLLNLEANQLADRGAHLHKSRIKNWRILVPVERSLARVKQHLLNKWLAKLWSLPPLSRTKCRSFCTVEAREVPNLPDTNRLSSSPTVFYSKKLLKTLRRVVRLWLVRWANRTPLQLEVVTSRTLLISTLILALLTNLEPSKTLRSSRLNLTLLMLLVELDRWSQAKLTVGIKEGKKYWQGMEREFLKI